MKIVVATDSFKGCMTSMEAGQAIKDGILNALDAEVKVFPLADGGEGTVEALMTCLNGERIQVNVTGPLGEKTESYYGILPDGITAVMEMANVAGITMLPDKSKNPMNTTTFGVGEMILDAVNRGCRKFIIGIGGSATNDGGLGMLSALGVDFYNEEGKKAGIYGRDVRRVEKVDISNISPLLKECSFTIMSDVTNPLCGEMGSSAIFGPQKGATPSIVEKMDEALKHYADVIKKDTGKDCSEMKGAGAAGGLGFAFLSFLNTSLVPGISYILDTLSLEDEMDDADIVITGEGKLDDQTLMGKAPAGVAALGKKHGAKVLAFTGNLALNTKANECMDAYFSICQAPVSEEMAMERDYALECLRNTVYEVFCAIKLFCK